MKSKQEIKVGIYARLSRDDERNGESLSIENQKLILEKYVLEQGWNLVETYVDDGYSGTTFDRPGVQRLLEDAKCGRLTPSFAKTCLGSAGTIFKLDNIQIISFQCITLDLSH